MNRNRLGFWALGSIVLMLPTVAGAALINTYGPSNITVSDPGPTYSLFTWGTGKLTDGSGFGGTAPNFTDANSNGIPEHDNNYLNMWVSNGNIWWPNQLYLVFDMGQAQTLGRMRVWNYNQSGLDNTGTLEQWHAGVGTADIYYTTPAAPDTYIKLNTTPVAFNPGTSNNGYDGVTDIAFSNLSVRKVAIVVLTNLYADGLTNQQHAWVGLSEVQFFDQTLDAPEPGTMALLAIGGAAVLRRRRR